MSTEYDHSITRIRRRDRSGIRNDDSLFIESFTNYIINESVGMSLFEYVLLNNSKIKHDITSIVIENQDNNKCECNICYEECEKRSFVKLNCGHEFCGKCVKKSLETTRLYIKAHCAYCRCCINSITFPSEESKSEFSDILE
jgi:hypothetical protein